MSGYIFIKQLGQGVQGRVVEVQNLSDNKNYAAKQISIKYFKQDLFEVLQNLNHPNLVKYFSYEVTDQNAYYLMERLNENSLYNYIAKKQLELSAIAFYTAQVMQALDYLHSFNILYRDLKPENLLLMQNGYLKLVDFDLSKKIKPNQKTNTICGSPAYMAPECVLGKPYNKSVDYWSVGILLYEFATGDVPFQGDTPLDIYKSIINKQIQFSSDFNKVNLRKLKKLILQLLTKSPSKRIQKIQSFNQILSENDIYCEIDLVELHNQSILAPFYP